MQAELDHIVLAVRDIEAALAFYLDVVGLEPFRVDAWRAGDAFFPCARISPGSIIDLLPPEFWNSDGDRTATHANVDHFCLNVAQADWEPLLRRLGQAGIETTDVMVLSGARGEGNSVYVTDPDGNKLELRYYD